MIRINTMMTTALFAMIFFQSYAQNEIRVKGIPYPLFWQNEPVKFSQSAGNFTIVAGAKTDMFRDPNVTYNTDNAPKLLFKPDSDFVLTVGIEHKFAGKWDGGAIVLMEDSLNWIKFCYEKDYTGARRVVSVVTKDISDDCNSVSFNNNKVYYKIAKAANVITLYCSTDNKSFYLVRHLQFNSTKALKLGFLAQSPVGERCEVTFSDVHYAAKTIKDPYTGE